MDIKAIIAQNTNDFGDLDVEVSKLPSPSNPEQFLRDVLSEAPRGIWLRLTDKETIQKYISHALKLGYVFHSARNTEVILRGWPSSRDYPDPAPARSFTWYTSAGIVINRQGEILMIQQSYDRERLWRPPGGCVDPGETAIHAAQREVLEETGIETEFVCVLGIHELPQNQNLFGLGQLAFICLLRPTAEKQTLQPQDSEISACAWFPIENCLKTGFPLAMRMKPFIRYAKAIWRASNYRDVHDPDANTAKPNFFGLGPSRSMLLEQDSSRLCENRSNSTRHSVLTTIQTVFDSVVQSSGGPEVSHIPAMIFDRSLGIDTYNAWHIEEKNETDALSTTRPKSTATSRACSTSTDYNLRTHMSTVGFSISAGIGGLLVGMFLSQRFR